MVGENAGVLLCAATQRVSGWHGGGAGAKRRHRTAAGRGRARRVKEQVCRHGNAASLPDISWRAHLLLLGVLRPGAGITSQAALEACRRHRFPVRAGLLSPEWMPGGHPLSNSVLPEHYSHVTAVSAEVAFGRLPARAIPCVLRFCCHLPAPGSRGTQRSGRLAGLAATRSVKYDESSTPDLRCRSLAGTARKLY